MNAILFAGWVVAGVALLVPFSLLVRLGHRLTVRPPFLRTMAIGPEPRDREATASSLYVQPMAQSLAARGAAQEGAKRKQAILRGCRAMKNLALYVAFIIGAIYFIPQILSWVLDTPHPMAAVSSQSMWPTLNKGDLIFLEGVDGVEDLQVGDIVAFQHEKGITVHRVIEIRGTTITTKGDANQVKDKPIDFSQVVGRVLTIRGRVARVPYVGSLPGLFGSFATRPTQNENEARSGKEQSGAPAIPPVSSTSPVTCPPGTNYLLSADGAGNPANAPSTHPAISWDGDVVAFVSSASNLVPGDTNGVDDVFVHDRKTGVTQRVSVDSAGLEANGHGNAPAISADGRFVAFVSSASNLVAGDTNGRDDVFVHDRETAATERVSVDSMGDQGNDHSSAPAISAGGRFIAFVSSANNLVTGDTNNQDDVFVHDRETGVTERVSVDSTRGQSNGHSKAPSISADGRIVAFASAAGNLVAEDMNGQDDVFVHDLQTRITERVSVGSTGEEATGPSGDAKLSADGRFVAFVSAARNLVSNDFNGKSDVFVHDRQSGTTELATVNGQGNQASSGGNAPAISADGRIVAFQAGVSNLVPADSNRFQDVFVHDRKTGDTCQVSVDSAGRQGNDHSGLPTISGDGRFVVFWSWATNLVPAESKQQIIVVHDRDGAFR